jgi:hypothetical protein
MTSRRCGRMAGSAAAGVGSGAAHARPRNEGFILVFLHVIGSLMCVCMCMYL